MIVTGMLKSKLCVDTVSLSNSHVYSSNFPVLGILVLIEFIILLIPYFYAFGLYKMTPKDPQANSSGGSETLSLPAFACEVFKVWDVFGYLTYREDDNSQKVLNP